MARPRPKGDPDKSVTWTADGQEYTLDYYDDSHRYWLTTEDGSTECSGVTSTLKRASGAGAGLLNWQRKVIREDAERRVDELAKLTKTAVKYAIGEACGAPDRERDAAGEHGKKVHASLEALAAGKKGRGPEYQALARWAQDWSVEFVAAEKPVCLVDLRVAGTGDAWVRAKPPGKPAGLYYVDLKTAKNVYPENHAQCATYVRAWEEMGGEQCDGWAVLHMPRGTDLPVVYWPAEGSGEGHFQAFMSALYLTEWSRTALG